ncbi:MAG: rhamnulokinase [Ruminococcus sp.]|nr:rhamnulokinase [Ruminococcus sp.]
MKKVLAIDFGASSGRAVLGEFDGKKISMTELHRFSNDPVFLGGTLYWDVLRLFHEIKQSLIRVKPFGVESVAIDTWGVDFGLVDADGRLLENPVHYRDSRTSGMLDEAFKLIDKQRFYEITGNQFMEINTAFQLLSLVKNRPDLLERADKLVMMPDLFSFLLSGKIVSERSIASTTQLFDANKRNWSDEVISALGIKSSLMPGIVKSGSVIGKLSDSICKELDMQPIDVISVCGHDTQSALAACPAEEKDFIFLSSGTWSLFGTELDKPIINEDSFRLNVTNELGVEDKTSFLKNIIGLWLIQESRRQWLREGREYSFMQLEEMARNASGFKRFIDPDSPEFTPAGNIPERIKKYCERTAQPIPQSDGEIMRCIYESLALKYRTAKGELEQSTGKQFDKIYMFGGGTKDKLLSQLTANACGCEVTSGPVEATALGNIGVQLMALGEISSLSQLREIVRTSEKLYSFEPTDCSAWNDAYKKYLEVVKNA